MSFCLQCNEQVKTEVLYIFSLPALFCFVGKIVSWHFRPPGYIYFGNWGAANTSGKSLIMLLLAITFKVLFYNWIDNDSWLWHWKMCSFWFFFFFIWETVHFINKFEIFTWSAGYLNPRSGGVSRTRVHIRCYFDMKNYVINLNMKKSEIFYLYT